MRGRMYFEIDRLAAYCLCNVGKKIALCVPSKKSGENTIERIKSRLNEYDTDVKQIRKDIYTAGGNVIEIHMPRGFVGGKTFDRVVLDDPMKEELK